MILMGYVTSLFIDKYNLAAAFRIQKINCNPSEILSRYKDSDIKYIILKQYMGRSYITCLLYTSPSPRDATLSRMPSSA